MGFDYAADVLATPCHLAVCRLASPSGVAVRTRIGGSYDCGCGGRIWPRHRVDLALRVELVGERPCGRLKSSLSGVRQGSMVRLRLTDLERGCVKTAPRF